MKNAILCVRIGGATFDGSVITRSSILVSLNQLHYCQPRKMQGATLPLAFALAALVEKKEIFHEIFP